MNPDDIIQLLGLTPRGSTYVPSEHVSFGVPQPGPDRVLAAIRSAQVQQRAQEDAKLREGRMAMAFRDVARARGYGYGDEEINDYLQEDYGLSLADVDAASRPALTAKKRKELQAWVAKKRKAGVSDADLDAAIVQKYPQTTLADVMGEGTSDARGLPAFAPADAVRGAGQGLSTQKLTELRQWVKAQREAGVSDSAISAAIEGKYGHTLADVMDPTSGDYARAGVSGLTLGFNDELGGALTGIIPGGAGYTETRDRIRANEAAARYAAPKRMLATEIAGGAIPGLLTLGASTPATGLTVGGRMLQAAKVGGGIGAASGLGHSEAGDVPGMAKDVAIGGAGGAAVGAGLSSLASLIRGVSAMRPQNAVMREAGSVLPEDAFLSVHGQEALVPGSSVLADRAPEMLQFAKLVGADPKAAQAATREIGGVVNRLEGWLSTATKAGRTLDDPDVAFISERLDAARALQETVKRSASQHAAARAGGLTAGSLDASVLRRPSILDVVAKLLAPSPAKRARVVQQMLVSPQGTQRALQMMSPEPAFPVLGRGLLFGGSEALGAPVGSFGYGLLGGS